MRKKIEQVTIKIRTCTVEDSSGEFGLSQTMRNMVEAYKQAKRLDPTLTFKKFIDCLQEA